MRWATLLLTASLAHAQGDLGPLLERLETGHALARHDALAELGALGPKARRARPEVVRALADEEPWVRMAAARALVRIGLDRRSLDPVIARFSRARPDVGHVLAQAVGDYGAEAVPALLDVIEGKDVRARRLGLVAVGEMGPDGAEAVPALLDLLAGDDAASAQLAGEGIRRCAPWAAGYVPEIAERLRFGEPKTKGAAARVLAMIGPGAKAAIPHLREAAKEGSPRLQRIARDALQSVDVVVPEGDPAPGLRDPSQAKEQAPDRFRARFETTKGDFVVEVRRDWAPHGADRFYNLVNVGFFDGAYFFRVVEGFVAQFGLNGDTRVDGPWREATIPDDPPKRTNARGTLAFAKTERPNSRTTQVFVNLHDNGKLDAAGFAPFGEVVRGMDVVDALNAEYGDGPPYGKGPDQRGIVSMGNAYLKRQFERLDRIRRATIVKE